MTLNTRQALDVIGTAYRVQGSTEEWLDGLIECARSALPQGVFLALEVELQTAGTRSGIVAGPNADERHVRFLEQGHHLAPDWCVKATYGSGKTWISLRECVEHRYFESAAWLQALRDDGLSDMLAVVSRHAVPRMPACALFSLAERPARASKLERRLWEQVAVHLGTAQSIRSNNTFPPAAVLRPDGTVVDAVDNAARSSETLRDLVTRWDRAHRRIPDRDAEATLDFWDRLASGRWLLVDHFDSDGRRYIVARQNPQTDPLRRLTTREREIAEHAAGGRTNDWISQELGLAHATVCEHLKNAQRKLGVCTRVELVDIINTAWR